MYMQTMPKIDSLSWSIQSEQGSLPVCVFSMLLVLDDGQELPAQGGQDQGAVSALHLLARAAEASDAAAAAKGRPDRTRRKKSTAAAHDADPANTAENEEQFMPAAVSTRAGGARQRGTGMNSKQAAVLQQEPGRGGAAKSAAPGAKGGAKRGASAPITAEGGKWVVDTKPAGKRTLSLEQVKDSPSKAPPGTAPPPTKVCACSQMIYIFVSLLPLVSQCSYIPGCTCYTQTLNTRHKQRLMCRPGKYVFRRRSLRMQTLQQQEPQRPQDCPAETHPPRG